MLLNLSKYKFPFKCQSFQISRDTSYSVWINTEEPQNSKGLPELNSNHASLAPATCLWKLFSYKMNIFIYLHLVWHAFETALQWVQGEWVVKLWIWLRLLFPGNWGSVEKVCNIPSVSLICRELLVILIIEKECPISHAHIMEKDAEGVCILCVFSIYSFFCLLV